MVNVKSQYPTLKLSGTLYIKLNQITEVWLILQFQDKVLMICCLKDKWMYRRVIKLLFSPQIIDDNGVSCFFHISSAWERLIAKISSEIKA